MRQNCKGTLMNLLEVFKVTAANDWSSVTLAIARIIAAKPHSCDVERLVSAYNHLKDSEELPQIWAQSILVTIPKKGDILSCSNYRTISLTSHSSEILLLIIINRLRAQLEMYLSEDRFASEQTGALYNRS